MFRPNLVGEISTKTGRDVHGRESWAEPDLCPFAIVNLNVGKEKTTVRADSSASRGAADQRVSDRGKILISKVVPVRIGDRFGFEGVSYLIASVHPRRSTAGKLDHFECDVEVLP